jgi:CTP:molybdopterin cytidylyltransferase MocA
MLAGRAVVVPGTRYKAVFLAAGIGRRMLTAKIGRMLREPVVERGGEQKRF